MLDNTPDMEDVGEGMTHWDWYMEDSLVFSHPLLSVLSFTTSLFYYPHDPGRVSFVVVGVVVLWRTYRYL